MDFILTGQPKFVKKVIAENSFRVRKGEVKFIPVNPANVGVLIADDKYVSTTENPDCKDQLIVDKKKPRKKKTSE